MKTNFAGIIIRRQIW